MEQNKDYTNKLVQVYKMSVGETLNHRGSSYFTDDFCGPYLSIGEDGDKICLLTPQQDLIYHEKNNIFSIL